MWLWSIIFLKSWIYFYHVRYHVKACLYVKSFIAKRLNSILVNLRYLRFKLLKYKENNKKICNTFDHNFKIIPLYIMRKVSLERYYFVLYDCALTSKMSKMVLKSFCDKTLHVFSLVHYLFWLLHWNLRRASALGAMSKGNDPKSWS